MKNAIKMNKSSVLVAMNADKVMEIKTTVSTLIRLSLEINY